VAAAWTRPAALDWAREILSQAGIDSPTADAEWLLAGILDVGRGALHLDRHLPEEAASAYARAVRRRARREPLQRILGWEEFHGLRFHLTGAVLIPRPETEVLVDWICDLLPPPDPGRHLVAVDLGTGSGCIACVLTRRRPDARVIGADLAPEAASVARMNAVALGEERRIHLMVGDLLDAVRPAAADLIVSNPPYLPTGMIASLAPEVSDHEPRQALDGGPDGLSVIRRLVRQAPSRLAAGGTLALETAGHAQACAVAILLNDAGFRQVLVHNDLAGVKRFVAGREHLAEGRA